MWLSRDLEYSGVFGHAEPKLNVRAEFLPATRSATPHGRISHPCPKRPKIGRESYSDLMRPDLLFIWGSAPPFDRSAPRADFVELPKTTQVCTLSAVEGVLRVEEE